MTGRNELYQEIDWAGRVQSTAAVMYHAALAALQGLSATDEKALDLIDRFGPLTARELSARSGLAPASVTSLIDRLEARELVRRQPNPADGRSILIALDSQGVAKLAPHFDDLVARLHELYDSYGEDELQVIADFLRRVAEVQQAATEQLAAHDELAREKR